ncbi:hypothetical protein AGABI2DRAFT_201991 [Agaricus bisporus var. bisporus H97]|uniref:hypothetical protein n=1 Tax=Agaricus bisporus var. bisporus (strain H97 / ATCC MYA-4626 / FGSC 10389) TaxID=936046 RepID=UPI00029F7463|nr:hypothetical protein AGABI2DRAFT_201991 [Agaricus bisporus var. bisporus H97]EKV49562.1 hypothetical protein AGABI2DRAFT_201991 [Agaricus bisporus var. bisporus H97]
MAVRLTPGFFVKKFLLHGQPFLVYPAAFWPLESPPKPSMWDLPYTDVVVTTSDNVQLKCYLIQHSTPRATVIMFHGNGMNHGFMLYHSKKYFSLECNILTVSYRGYGDSQGVPSERGLQRDAQGALDWVLAHDELAGLPIVVYGLSLGGAVAIDVASRNTDKIAALILENTFTSIPDIVHDWPIIGYFSFLCTQRWNSACKLARIPASLPILFLSGRSDYVVPPRHMDNLWEIAKQRGRKKSGRKIARIHGGCWTSSQQTDGSDGENSEGPAIKDEEWSSPKKDQFISFSSGGHVDTYEERRYWPHVKKFLQHTLDSSSSSCT